jgi:hypothetical protein
VTTPPPACKCPCAALWHCDPCTNPPAEGEEYCALCLEANQTNRLHCHWLNELAASQREEDPIDRIFRQVLQRRKQ